MASINNFILVVKIDSLSEYSQNHIEIITEAYTDIIGRLGTIALRAPEDISSYDYYVLNKSLNLVEVTANFAPENKQIVILLNQSIEFTDISFSVVTGRILEYLKQFYIEKFLSQVPKSFYKNLALSGFAYNVLPPREDATTPPKSEPLSSDVYDGSSVSSGSSSTSSISISSISSDSSVSTLSTSTSSESSQSSGSSVSTLSSVSSGSTFSSTSDSSQSTGSSDRSTSSTSSSSQQTSNSSVSSKSESSASESTIRSGSDSTSSESGSFSSNSSSSLSSAIEETDWSVITNNPDATINGRTYIGESSETVLSRRVVGSGQWYAEVEVTGVAGRELAVGIASNDINASDPNGFGFKGSNYELTYNGRTGDIYENAVFVSNVSSASPGDIVSIFLDFNAGTNGQVTLRLNNVNIVTRDMPSDLFVIVADGTLVGLNSEGLSRFRLEQFVYPLPVDFEPFMPIPTQQSSASESSATESTNTSTSGTSLSTNSTSSSSSNTPSTSSSSNIPSFSSSTSTSTSDTSRSSVSTSSPTSVSTSSSSTPFVSSGSTSSSSDSSTSSTSSSSESSASTPSASSVSSPSQSTSSTSSEQSESSFSSPSSISNEDSGSSSSSSGEISLFDESIVIETQMMGGANLSSYGEDIFLKGQIFSWAG